MKTALFSLIMLSVTCQALAQELLYEATIRKEEMPTAIVKAIETDFPEYSVTAYNATPSKYIEGFAFLNREINSTDGYDAYTITLLGKEQELSATYDKNGKLLSGTEHILNVAPPAAVRSAIAKAYPGWTLEKDAYNMARYESGKEKERYRLVLTKGNEKIRVYSDVNGMLLNGPGRNFMDS